MSKVNSLYECTNCGYQTPKPLGRCPSCEQFGTFTEVMAMPKELDSLQEAPAMSLKDIAVKDRDRIKSDIFEFDRVLGGGLVNGEVVLISGEPGIGKSTLLLQILANLAKQKIPSVYVSAEESIEQIAVRAKRLFAKAIDLDIISAFEIDAILGKLKELKPKIVVIDSVQTVYSQESLGLPGSVSQIKNVSSKIVNFAKRNGICVILVGHINKEGTIAGPKLLEHLVDCVLQLEGDEQRGWRLLRSLKNRYGSTAEIGIFEMDDKGMQEVSDPTQYFMEDKSEKLVGVCPSVILEGSRPLIIEVQALTVPTPYSLPKRITEGINKSKLEVLAAIIGKYSKIDLSSKDIYVTIAGGMKVKDPGIDLAVVLAILSSVKEKPLPAKLIAFGEIALTGRIKPVLRESLREKEVQRLGYQTFSQLSAHPKDVRSLFTKF